MEEINRIYYNSIGVAFQWKRDIDSSDKVQVIFRDTGFYLSPKEISKFAFHVKQAMARGCCRNCKRRKECRSILLKTPSNIIDLAVSKEELILISDLIEGTLFQLELKDYLNRLCSN